MAWTISYTDSARKQLRKLDQQVARKILDYMDARVTDYPRAVGKALKGELGEIWRYRVGDARVLCDIQDQELIVLVVKLGHRKNVYD